MHEITLTVDEILKSLEHQSVSDWSAEYIAKGVDDVHDRFSIFLRCSVHFHHHIGQMIYLAKAINGDTNDRLYLTKKKRIKAQTVNLGTTPNQNGMAN